MSKTITSGARVAVEVGFGDKYVRKPHNRHNTNVIMVGRDVDTIEERGAGVLVTKKHDGVTYRSLYPWSMIHDVKYEPVPDAVAEEKDAELLG